MIGRTDHLFRPLTLLLACLAALICALPASSRAAIPAETGWHEPSAVRLEMSFPGEGYHASWKIHRCPCGDLLIESEMSLPGEVHRSELLLVDGRALLSRGFEDGGPNPVEAIDTPALMMQLALRLLERSAPQGPAAISGQLPIDLKEEIHAINLDSGHAAGGFQAPWSVNGDIQAVTDTWRRFDLLFRFSVLAPGETQAQEAEIRIAGHAEFAHKDFPLTGDTPLEDWRLDWRNEPLEIDKPASLAALREALDQSR
jgi:hypothetical protein